MKEANKSIFWFVGILFLLTFVVEVYIITYILQFWITDLLTAIQWLANVDTYKLCAVLVGIALFTEIFVMIKITKKE